jgi:hypothetical protein
MKTRIKATAAAALATSALFAMTAPSASAADIPKVLNGNASAQAMVVNVTIPTVTQLRNAMVAAGLPVSAIPDLDIPEDGVHNLIISSDFAQATKANAVMHADGWASPLRGSVEVPRSETACAAATCSATESVAKQRVEVPLGLGFIDVAGASSATPTHLSSQQRTAAVEVDLSLRSVLDDGMALAAVGDALDTLRTQLNTTVLPPLNGAIDTVKTTIDGVAVLQPLKQEIDRIITVDHVKPLPDLSKADLVTATVLGGAASVTDETRSNMTGLSARSESTVIDLEILDGWASIDSIKVTAEAYANSVKGANGADANSHTDIANATFGGLLGVHVSADDLIHLSESETLKAVARDTVRELGLTNDISDIENAIELIYDVAGLSIVKVPNVESVSPAGIKAEASANSLVIKVQPKFPNFTKLQQGLAGGHVPLLADSDYIPSGISISVELPSATAAVQATTVRSVCIGSCVPVTGVGTPWIVAAILLGSALLVRRFVIVR